MSRQIYAVYLKCLFSLVLLIVTVLPALGRIDIYTLQLGS
jgi:hypothetical protein